MNILILSPDRQIFSGEAKSVIVPGIDGQFQMLERHAAIVSALGKGEVRIVQTNGEKLTYAIQGGFVEMLNNEVSLLVSGVSQ